MRRPQIEKRTCEQIVLMLTPAERMTPTFFPRLLQPAARLAVAQAFEYAREERAERDSRVFV